MRPVMRSRAELSSSLVLPGDRRVPTGLLPEARAWARGRNGWVRLPLLLYFAHVLRMHLRDPDYESIFGALNLVIHEAGHLACGFLGELAGVAGGTLLQLLVPCAAWFMFRRRDLFALGVVGCWLGTSLFSVARYIADARTRALPLVSPTSGDPQHDWAYLLGRFGLLQQDALISGAVRLLAISSMLAGLVFGGWIVWLMVRRTASAGVAPQP